MIDKPEAIEPPRRWVRLINAAIELISSIKKRQSIILSQSAAETLYTADNIHELQNGDLAEIDYLKCLVQHSVSHYIDNISAKVNLLKINDQLFPLLIASNNYEDSYVCSPYGHYISLALESLFLLKNKWLKKAVTYGLKSFGLLVKAGEINSVVYLNHSLFSTDLQCDALPIEEIERVISVLKNKFPRHAIIFRSLNSQTCPALQNQLQSTGFKLIASRQIYLTQMNDPALFRTRIIKSDLRLWDESACQIIEHKDFTEEDEKRILELYTLLAIDSHSTLNPKINLNFFKLMKKHPTLFKLQALKKGDKIEGVVGYYIKQQTLVCSFFGYDKRKQNKTEIYRLLSTLLLLEAKKKAKIFHQSAGASFYKSIRRAQGLQEYHAVYMKHLPIKQQLTWHAVKAIMNTLAVPFMKKY